MTKRKLFIITLVLSMVLYSLAWMYVSNYIKKLLKQEEALINKELSGDELILSGYPFDIKFTIKGENRQNPILRQIDAVSLNLFSRQISLHIKNDPAAKPFTFGDLENIEFIMKPNSDAIYYFKLNSYSMVVNYTRNKEDKLDWIDLFNLSQETGLKGSAFIRDKQTSTSNDASVLFSAKLPGKKIYKDFDELYIDLPHHLSATLEYAIDVSYEDSTKVPSLVKRVNQAIHPSSGKIDITFNLPEGVFGAEDIGDIAKNVELKIIGRGKGGGESGYNLSLTNASEQMQFNVDARMNYSKEYINLIQTLYSNKEEVVEFVKYMVVQYGGQMTSNAEEKLRLFVDKCGTKFTSSVGANIEAKYNIALMIPHKPDTGKNATYNFYVGDSKKTFVIDWKGDVSTVNLSNPFAGFPVVNGSLSIVDKQNIIGELMEMKDLFLLGIVDEVSIDIFKKRLDRFENNSILWSGMLKSLSDDPQSTSGEMQYTHNLDFTNGGIMKSKFSKTSTLEDVINKWGEVQMNSSLMPQEVK